MKEEYKYLNDNAQILNGRPNEATFSAIYKCESYFISHHNIMVSISGGADSDIMIDMIEKVIKENKYNYNVKIYYVFFDTGIEYQATKEHLDYLEQKYNIKIERYRAIVPVPLGCKKYGLPFLSKQVSENIDRLQKYNFKFEDEDFETLLKRYPKCKCALKWWCNMHENKSNGKPSNFNISYNSYLKEFMIANPPTFKISQKCCKGAKKDNAHKVLKDKNIDLNCVGIRKAEGGVRASAYKSCFNTCDKYGADGFRPIFWFTDKDKKEYEEFYNIKHSDCYCKYGLKRTGCVGCPFGKDFEVELENAKQFEPMLYVAVNNIFKDSYEYTRKYREFQKLMKERTDINKEVRKCKN